MDEAVHAEIESPGLPIVGAGLGTGVAGQAAQAESGSSAVPPISQAIPREIGSWPGGALSAAEAAHRAEIMFLSGSGDVFPTSRGWTSAEATFELLETCTKAVNDLFGARRADIHESCGALDREEALGYLVADCLGRELIDTEARAVGKRANYRMSACKTEVEKAEASAKKRTSRVRGKVTNEVVLEARLATIEEEKASAIAAVYDATYDLKLPDPKSKVVVKEVEPPAVVDPEVARLALLMEAAREATGALDAAKLDLPDLMREITKTKNATLKELKALNPPVKPKDIPNSEAMEKYFDACDVWKISSRGGIDLLKQLQKMERDLRLEILELELDAADAELEASRAQRAAEERAARAAYQMREDADAAEKAESQRRVAAAMDRCRASDANAAAIERMIVWARAWDARPSVLCETPAETRARLEADAERVWGSNWRDKACMDTDH
jgi:hypothetical protein